MKRSFVYIIVVLMTITLVVSDYYIGRDLKNIIPLDDTYRSVEPVDVNAGREITDVGTLTIKNEQNTDDKINYSYLVKINSLSGAYRYTYNGQEKIIVFTANGEATFKLNNNEELTIYDIPVDLEYTIIQKTTNGKFTVRVNSLESTTFQGTTSESNNVTFNNSTKKSSGKSSSKGSSSGSKETKKEDKKDIPNTGEKELKAIAILLMAIILLLAIKKFKVKRFD